MRIRTITTASWTLAMTLVAICWLNVRGQDDGCESSSNARCVAHIAQIPAFKDRGDCDEDPDTGDCFAPFGSTCDEWGYTVFDDADCVSEPYLTTDCDRAYEFLSRDIYIEDCARLDGGDCACGVAVFARDVDLWCVCVCAGSGEGPCTPEEDPPEE